MKIAIFFKQKLMEFTNLALFNPLLSGYALISSTLFNDNFHFLWDLELDETICFITNHVLMIISFSTVWPSCQMAAATAKQRLVLKEWSGMLLVLMMFNKGCLLLIIYKVCIGDVIQNQLL